ncbi:MAG: His/Gly/Thr/Pro-type tRNA ligase C-terminal domain-containing protein, partial [Candidatus Latescibacteria bacterium]|nr:His/Gly/Thr/Pro-type tRNA ligase C-terminal domain-containing protein [Candidatus Latescibacterota bacterium]
VVTHGGGKELEEPLVLRPTSETVIWATYAKWIQSYRDLPLLYNQWANVVRWEMRPRLFLRTTEFLWQEGHTAHATENEARAETESMLEVYRRFAEEWMALPVITGRKSDSERFAGAIDTFCIEAMMGDTRALQAGTSHFLGQNFAKAFDVTYQDSDGGRQHVWATSWGVSTRLVGALVMGHGDDKGLILPPKLAPYQVVVVPIYREPQRQEVLDHVDGLIKTLPDDIRVHVDDRDQFKPGYKFNDWEMRGVPLRVEVGPKDIEKGTLVLARRDSGEKEFIPQESLAQAVAERLGSIQTGMFEKAKNFREENTTETNSWDEFEARFSGDGGGGGFVWAHWDGTEE